VCHTLIPKSTAKVNSAITGSEQNKNANSSGPPRMARAFQFPNCSECAQARDICCRFEGLCAVNLGPALSDQDIVVLVAYPNGIHVVEGQSPSRSSPANSVLDSGQLWNTEHFPGCDVLAKTLHTNIMPWAGQHSGNE
jgi:hypothetical protein